MKKAEQGESKVRRDYVIEIAHHNGTTYIVRKGKFVSYQSGDETPLALSNLVHENATTLKWHLESALDGDEAERMINVVLTRRWENNLAMKPRVTLLDSRVPL